MMKCIDISCKYLCNTFKIQITQLWCNSSCEIVNIEENIAYVGQYIPGEKALSHYYFGNKITC